MKRARAATMQNLPSLNSSAPRSPDIAANYKKVVIEARSLLDLQLKLAKHPNWRILEISRLNFGFKLIAQRKPKESQQPVPKAVPHRALTNVDFISRRKFSAAHKNILPK